MIEPKDATPATRMAQEALAARLPLEDGSDTKRARRGFIDTIPDARVTNAQGRPVWDMAPFAFEADEGPAPASVNPSLWRQARLNLNHGLFEVTPGIYQVRGFDISNITFIEGKSGYLVIDPLTSAEPAAAALALVRRHRGDKPVSGVIYTHSHVDHYGGIMGVLDAQAIAEGARIIAPEGFLAEAVSENVLAGNAMNRRATYMYGALLPRGPRGHVDSGLGKAVSGGQVNLVPPTESIRRTGERLTIDGVEIAFQVTPGTEAPAEMNFYFPQFKALCMAENCSCHLHNLYTPRGAQVRDAAREGARLVVVPELATSGYVFSSLQEARAWAEPLDGRTVTLWSDLASELGLVIVGGLSELDAEALYNVSVIVDPSGLRARYRKAHLWGDEPDFFVPGDALPPVVDTAVGRVATMVCYDLEFPEWSRFPSGKASPPPNPKPARPERNEKPCFSATPNPGAPSC